MGLIGFEGGARMLLESDMPQDWPGGSFIQGTEGTLRLTGESLEVQNGDSTGWQAVEPDPSVDQHQELKDWIERGPESRQAARLARATMEVMMAVYESSRVRRLVTLPMAVGPSPLHDMIEDGTLPVQVPGKYDIRA